MFKRQNCRTVIFHSKHFINTHLIDSETAQDVIMVIYEVKYGRNHNSENFKILQHLYPSTLKAKHISKYIISALVIVRVLFRLMQQVAPREYSTSFKLSIICICI